MLRLKTIAPLIVLLTLLCSCKKTDSVDIQETGQQIGDVMASMDEMGGSSGSMASSYSPETFSRLAPEETQNMSHALTGVRSVACVSADTFSSCSSNAITRTFGGCTILGVTFEGTVAFTWADGSSSCRMTAAGHTVSRSPAFTATGRRGATLTVSKTGTYGQKITKTGATSFTFSNDGIRRVFAASGVTLFDFTTQTTSDIGISGVLRSTRVLDGGTLRVTNNLTSTTCDLTPSAVTWASSCNCAVSGSWTGTCSDGKTSTLTLTGCGTASLAVGSESEAFSFDRCYSI